MESGAHRDERKQGEQAYLKRLTDQAKYEQQHAGGHNKSGVLGLALAQVPFAGGDLKSAADDTADFLGSGGGKIGTAIASGTTKAVETLAEGTGLNSLPRPLRDLDKNALKDIVNIPVQAVPSLYQLGDAYFKAQSGDASGAKKLAKGVADQSVLGQLLYHGSPKKALKLAEEHPVNAALELSGARSVIGRSAGTAARLSPSKTLRDVASTERAPLEVSGNVSVNRHYSKDLTTKGAQKLAEAFTRNVRKRDPNVATRGQAQRELRRRMAEHGAMNEVLRREGRQVAKNVMHNAEPGVKGPKTRGGARPLSVRRLADVGGKHSEILGLIAQKIVRGPGHLRDDLVKYRDLLKDTAEHSDPPLEAWQLKANESLRASIDKALGDENFMKHPDHWFEAADTYARERNLVDAEKKDIGLLTDGQEAAKNLPALMVHGDVRHDATRSLPTPEYERARALAGDAKDFDGLVQNLERHLTNTRQRLHIQQGRIAATGGGSAKHHARVQEERIHARIDENEDRLATLKPGTDAYETLKRSTDTLYDDLSAARKTQSKAKGKVPRKTSRNKLDRLQAEVTSMEDSLASLKELKEASARGAKEAHPGKGSTHWRPRWFQGDRHVTVEDGLRMLEDHGAQGAAFLSHSPKSHGAAAYHRTWDKRPEREMNKRTGDSILKGMADTSWRAMTDDLVGARGTVDAAKAWDRAMTEFGIGPNQGFFSGRNARKDAEDYARNLQEKFPGQYPDLVPVRVAPLRERADVVEQILDDLGPLGDLPHDVANIMTRMVDEAERPGPGPVALVPREVLKTWRDVATGAKSSDALKAFQMMSQNFRRVVLPFSTKWLAGNLLEATFRSAMYGHGPGDWLRAHRGLQKLEEYDREHGTNHASEFAARTLGGRLYGSTARMAMRRGAEQLSEGSRLQKLVAAGGTAARVPGIHLALRAVKRTQDSIFGMNEFLEDQFAKAAIGAAMKKNITETADSLLGAAMVTEKALDEFVKNGLTDTNTQVELARYLDEVLGRYSKHSPSERQMIQTFMPFWDWYRNAFDFVMVTLPTKHPIKTGLLVALEDSLQKGLQADGQTSIFQSGGLPGFLKGTAKTESGSRIPLQKYLPFGAFSDPLDAASGLLLPQFSSAQLAFAGLNWKGKPLAVARGGDANGTDRAFVFFNGLFESQVPGATLLRRFLEHGASAYDDSSLLKIKTRSSSKKLDFKGTARKIFDPFAPIPPGSATRKKGAPSLKDALKLDSGLTGGGGSGDISDLMSALGG